ncbi:hypothetical protein ACFQ34_09650 [Pseudonocardia benzenivorans]|uniref:Anti-sigma factor NepR domain-containing protein n=1 Tax=Pseudonocardia benzenivorans TaxID=228005 RepID=A0ABW3VEI9_9PSEU
MDQDEQRPPSLRELAMAGFNGTARRYERLQPERVSDDELVARLLRALRGGQDDDQDHDEPEQPAQPQPAAGWALNGPGIEGSLRAALGVNTMEEN